MEDCKRPRRQLAWGRYGSAVRVWNRVRVKSGKTRRSGTMLKLTALLCYGSASFPNSTAAASLMQTLFPDDMVYSVAATSVFYIPIWR